MQSGFPPLDKQTDDSAVITSHPTNPAASLSKESSLTELSTIQSSTLRHDLDLSKMAIVEANQSVRNRTMRAFAVFQADLERINTDAATLVLRSVDKRGLTNSSIEKQIVKTDQAKSRLNAAVAALRNAKEDKTLRRKRRLEKTRLSSVYMSVINFPTAQRV